MAVRTIFITIVQSRGVENLCCHLDRRRKGWLIHRWKICESRQKYQSNFTKVGSLNHWRDLVDEWNDSYMTLKWLYSCRTNQNAQQDINHTSTEPLLVLVSTLYTCSSSTQQVFWIDIFFFSHAESYFGFRYWDQDVPFGASMTPIHINWPISSLLKQFSLRKSISSVRSLGVDSFQRIICVVFILSAINGLLFGCLRNIKWVNSLLKSIEYRSMSPNVSNWTSQSRCTGRAVAVGPVLVDDRVGQYLALRSDF